MRRFGAIVEHQILNPVRKQRDLIYDLILLGENHIYLLAQKADHTLGEPEKIPFSGT